MDQLEFCCQACGQKVSTSEDSRGEEAACPNCANAIKIPLKGAPQHFGPSPEFRISPSGSLNDAPKVTSQKAPESPSSRENKRLSSKMKTHETQRLMSDQISQIVAEFGPESIIKSGVIFTKLHSFRIPKLGRVEGLAVFVVENVRSSEISAKRLVERKGILSANSYLISNERHTFNHRYLDIHTLELILLVLEHKV